VGDKRLNYLFIWIDGQRVATLSHHEGNFELAYEASWVTSGGYPISPHLPLIEVSRGAAVKHFFSNLLPEGELLEGLSQAHQVSKFDIFGLLKKVGRDCAGAMIIADTDQPVIDDSQHFDSDGYQQIRNDEFNQQIIDSRHAKVPLMFLDRKPRMSLAGVQNKIGVYIDANETLMLPRHSQPTSHILKIGDPRYPGMAANEYFCMRLAQALGLSVPDTHFRKLPEPVLLVHRYDRDWTQVAGTIKRRHQIDACQALNLPPNQKYEQPAYEYAPTGATLADIVSLAKLCDIPSAALATMLNWVLFNYLIGNTDAHAKNLSFLIDRASEPARLMGRQASIVVAPLYDLVCGSVYGLDDFAQNIGNEDELALISTIDWREFAKLTGIAPKLVRRLGEMLVRKISQNLDGVANKVLIETSAEVVTEISAHVRGQTIKLQESLSEL
jgi:serine/threonine-protein kinase HipA